MTPEEALLLLNTEENESLERKSSLSDRDAIRNTLIAFANDLGGNGTGYLILGQSNDKKIVGLKVGSDEAERIIADIARARCSPAIPISEG